jgi:hypothetical protein
LQRESSGARRLVLNIFVGTCASSAQGKAHRVPLQNFDKLARVRNEKFVATVVVDIDQRSRRSNRIIDAARGSKKFLSLPSLSPICYCCVLLSSSSSSSSSSSLLLLLLLLLLLPVVAVDRVSI